MPSCERRGHGHSFTVTLSFPFWDRFCELELTRASQALPLWSDDVVVVDAEAFAAVADAAVLVVGFVLVPFVVVAASSIRFGHPRHLTTRG